MWWIIVPALLALFVAVILLRGAMFRPHAEEKSAPSAVAFDEEKAVRDLQRMVRVKTISSRDPAKVDPGEFEAFRALLRELYPRVHGACSCEHIGANGLLYLWKGRSDAEPTVYMAHYDVVPANEGDWQKPPFEGILENGELWGRGTLDTKVTLCGALSAAETLLEKGFVPQNDVYFAFAGDEEIAGGDAPAIVSALESRGVRPALVVDEGGAVVEGVFPGVTAPCALIGIGEKGMMDLEITAKSAGGHASSPPPHTPVGLLARAVARVESKPFKAHLTKPAAEMFDALGRHSNFLYRVIFANLWCFEGLLNALCKKTGGELNALMRTTCAFTMMKGSSASNVLPPEAVVGANLRLMGGDTAQTALAYIQSVVKDPALEYKVVHSMNPSPFSSTQSPGWRKVKAAVEQTWPDAIVSPYLMIACSDSRHYARISENVYRFSAMALSGEERARIHGNDERIPVGKIKDAVGFYLRLIAQS